MMELQKLKDVYEMGFIQEAEYQARVKALLSSGLKGEVQVESNLTRSLARSFGDSGFTDGLCDACGGAVPEEEETEHLDDCSELVHACPNVSSGCNELMLRRDVWSHLAECRYYNIVCVYCMQEDKYQEVQFNDFEGHVREKHLRDVANPFVTCANVAFGCRWRGLRDTALTHLQECQHHVVACGDCDSFLPRSDLAGHYEEVHKPASVVPDTISCPNATQGCKVRLSRFEMCSHVNKCLQPCLTCGCELPCAQLTAHEAECDGPLLMQRNALRLRYLDATSRLRHNGR